MISLAKSLLALAPLVSIVLSSPTPLNSSSQASALEKRVDTCKHCYSCVNFYPSNRVLSFVGEMTVPSKNDPLADGAINYLWPGVQTDNDAATVLQTVLQGNTDGGAFNMFQNWLAGPKDTYGVHQDNYVPVNLGDKLSFSMSITADGKSWDIDANGAKNNYPFHDDFTQAVFCGEFYESAWNFGELRFDNVQIVVQGSDASFCVEGGQSITGGATAQFGAISTVSDPNGNTVCNIESLVMNHV